MAAPNSADAYFSNADMSASITGHTVDLLAHPDFSFHFVWTGVDTPTGTFSIDVSNDATTWEALTDASTTSGGIAGSELFDIDAIRARYVRAKYVRVSGGTGDTCNATLVVKGGTV